MLMQSRSRLGNTRNGWQRALIVHMPAPHGSWLFWIVCSIVHSAGIPRLYEGSSPRSVPDSSNETYERLRSPSFEQAPFNPGNWRSMLCLLSRQTALRDELVQHF